jgi:hypothetical protein
MIKKAIIKLIKKRIKDNNFSLKCLEKEYGYVSIMDSDYHLLAERWEVNSELKSLLKTIKQVSSK